MKKVLLLSIAFSTIIAGLSMSYYYLIYLPRRDGQETSTKEIFKEEVKGVEDVPVEAETTPPAIIFPTPSSVIGTPTSKTIPIPTPSAVTPTDTPEPEVITKTIIVPNYVDESKILEAERKAREAEECQRKTAVYSKCTADFNESMTEYAECQKRNNEVIQTYNDKMEKYSECIDDYNDKLEVYNECKDPNSWRYNSLCFKPSNYCSKPFPVYPGSCNKPMNWCTKPYCL